jgi:serine/threonine-protein kinase
VTSDDPRLLPTEAATTMPAPEPGAPPRAVGYTIGALIGRGGMGEVLLAHDARIDRDVALKRMRDAAPSSGAVARFLREAKIQARLDHPAIVPVHELGEDDQHRPYFTMKRIAGTTLAALVADPAATPQRLLRAFVDVCLAIARAHALGVVHRDLKPSNVMLGDFGEVYVLDWGVARVLAEADDVVASAASAEGATEVGAVLGTPGYMAPEQAAGELVGTASDVYALGCILFELLARERLHVALPADYERDPSPASRRGAPIAPELDAACVAALAVDAAARPSARDLADRVQGYLDGDRDLERRRALAADQLARARGALAADDRATAIYEAGRALALDPESDAGDLLRELVEHKPTVPPPPLVARFAELDRAVALTQYRQATRYFLGFYAFLPLVIWQGTSTWWPYVLLYVAVTAFIIGGWRGRGHDAIVVPLVTTAILLFAVARLASPFVIVPGIAGTVITGFAAHPLLVDRWWATQLCILGALVTSLALERCGVLASTWAVEHEHIEISPDGPTLGGVSTELILILSLFATLVIGGALVRRLALDRREAQRELEIRAWHLRQLVRR